MTPDERISELSRDLAVERVMGSLRLKESINRDMVRLAVEREIAAIQEAAPSLFDPADEYVLSRAADAVKNGSPALFQDHAAAAGATGSMTARAAELRKKGII